MCIITPLLPSRACALAGRRRRIALATETQSTWEVSETAGRSARLTARLAWSHPTRRTKQHCTDCANLRRMSNEGSHPVDRRIALTPSPFPSFVVSFLFRRSVLVRLRVRRRRRTHGEGRGRRRVSVARCERVDVRPSSCE